METSDLRAYFSALPKIDLHRHLEGTIRLETLLEIAEQYNIALPDRTAEGLRGYVQVTPTDANDALHFLKKFGVLRRFFCAPEVIQRVAREAVIDAARDNVKYLELRFTPRALAKLMDFTYYEVTQWVCEGVAQAQRDYDIRVGLIVSINRHESVADGDRQMRTAVDHKWHGVVGFDLCGREADYPADPFYEIFRQARQSGLGITVHAGEWVGPRNVRDAIERIGAHRIGHGVRIIEDNRITQMALDNRITFEVCPTSNVQSGVVHAMNQHPLRDMNYLGLRTTLNTDDPAISNITLTDELVNAVENLGMTTADVQRSLVRSAEAAFLLPSERAILVARFANVENTTADILSIETERTLKGESRTKANVPNR